MIRSHGLAPPSSRSDDEAWPFSVQIQTLGAFRVLVEDRPLEFQRKAQKKPLELLKAIVAFGSSGDGVREDRLADALWPDADADAAAGALTSTLHRLRRLIGENAITRQEGRLGLVPERCSVDLWRFGELLTRFERDAPSAAAPERASRTERLLALYRGPFLPGDADTPWLIERRQRVRADLLRWLRASAEFHVATGDPVLAQSALEHARRLHPEREDL
jgi:DNA-binding SARP family transcriptional activator